MQPRLVGKDFFNGCVISTWTYLHTLFTQSSDLRLSSVSQLHHCSALICILEGAAKMFQVTIYVTVWSGRQTSKCQCKGIGHDERIKLLQDHFHSVMHITPFSLKDLVRMIYLPLLPSLCPLKRCCFRVCHKQLYEVLLGCSNYFPL